jgi:hypothetical protein
MEEAARHFEQAEALFHAPTLQLMIARTHARRGLLLEAEAAYRKLLAEDLAPEAPAEFPQAQATGRAELEALAARIPRLVLRLSDPSAAARVELSFDGRPLSAGELDRPIRCNPGSHAIVLTAPGVEPVSRTVTLAEAEHMTIELPVAAGAASAGAPLGGEAEPPSGSLMPALAAFGVGAVGLVAGTVAGALALDKQSELEARCPTRHCFPEDEELADAASVNATVSTVGFVVAGVGAAAGVTLLIVRSAGTSSAGTQSSGSSPNGSSSQSLQLEVGPSGVAVLGSF